MLSVWDKTSQRHLHIVRIAAMRRPVMQTTLDMGGVTTYSMVPRATDSLFCPPIHRIVGPVIPDPRNMHGIADIWRLFLTGKHGITREAAPVNWFSLRLPLSLPAILCQVCLATQAERQADALCPQQVLCTPSNAVVRSAEVCWNEWCRCCPVWIGALGRFCGCLYYSFVSRQLTDLQ
jgi:hypothetical protein